MARDSWATWLAFPWVFVLIFVSPICTPDSMFSLVKTFSFKKEPIEASAFPAPVFPFGFTTAAVGNALILGAGGGFRFANGSLNAFSGPFELIKSSIPVNPNMSSPPTKDENRSADLTACDASSLDSSFLKLSLAPDATMIAAVTSWSDALSGISTPLRFSSLISEPLSLTTA